MKIPRHALFALLVLASAANAALPFWTVVDESFRAWPTIYFKVGNNNHSLRCQLSECDPAKNKGKSNLYILTQDGKPAPIKAMINEYIELWTYDPRRLIGDADNRRGYKKVPKVIDSFRTRYVTTLSNFKLDNSGKELVVVQGAHKYPATTDIHQNYVSALGSVIAVAPPTKIADDVVKPVAPVTTPRNRGTTPVVTEPDVDAGASLALIDGVETRWLTKRQAAEYKGERAAAKNDTERKAVDDKYRALVKAQIRPEAAAAYAAAAALPVAEAPAKIKDAIDKVEMWGGKDVSAIVAPFQETPNPKLLEIQLSKAEYEVLKSSQNAAALTAYTNSRIAADGTTGTNEKLSFSLENYDPVKLHLITEAARKIVGPVTEPVVNPTQPGGGELVPLLTDAEKKLLTPEELATYKSIFDSAKGDPKDKNLQAEARRLRALIAAENRGKDPAYAVPADRAAFDKLPEWQKRKFCADLVASPANLAGDTRAAELGGTGDAAAQLDQTAGRSPTNGPTTTTTSAATGWAADACKPYKAPPVVTNPAKPPVKTDVPTPPGVDKENEAKKKNEWLTADLLTSAAKGAMVGLLLGSFFGPVGLIAGPLLGAALFYGLTKIM